MRLVTLALSRTATDPVPREGAGASLRAPASPGRAAAVGPRTSIPKVFLHTCAQKKRETKASRIVCFRLKA